MQSIQKLGVAKCHTSVFLTTRRADLAISVTCSHQLNGYNKYVLAETL
jgi:hypothetical protein